VLNCVPDGYWEMPPERKAQEQVASGDSQALQLSPRGVLGCKRDIRHETGACNRPVSTGYLRGDRQEELVRQADLQERAEEPRPALVEDRPDPEFRPETTENIGRVKRVAGCHAPHRDRVEPRASVVGEPGTAPLRSDDERRHVLSVKGRLGEVDHPTLRDDDVERLGRSLAEMPAQDAELFRQFG